MNNIKNSNKMNNIKNSNEMNNIKNKYFFSWNKDLQEKITSKEKKMSEMSNIIRSLKENNVKKENEIEDLEKTMENILENVEKYIKNYLDNINSKFSVIKNKTYENSSEKAKDIFKLYKEMYQDAKEFFSRKDFNYENSSLKTKIKETFQDYLICIFDDDDYNDWANILIPIWSLEKMYKDMEEEHKQLDKSYKTLQKKFQYKKKVYDDLNNDIEKMKKELQDLKDFSSKIKTNI